MAAKDQPSPSPLVNEALVARLWDDRRFLSLPLHTATGRELQVVYGGRRRWDRGPDFAAALLAWDGRDLQHGDVEVHVRSSDWRAHGHHRDPNYNSVMLQVVMFHDAREPSLRQDRVEVPVVALQGQLAVDLDGLAAAWESAPAPSLPCWPGSPDDAGLRALLEFRGMERFTARAGRLEEELVFQDPEQLLYVCIAEALGYSQNREQFRTLASAAPIGTMLAAGRLRPGPVAFEALLLGAAGLLPSQRGIESGGDGYAQELEECWPAERRERVSGVMRASDWQFFRVRPANFPTRRVAVLAGLLACWPRCGLQETLIDLARSSKPKALPRALEALLLEAGASSYWTTHCDFGVPLSRPGRPLGRQRAAEVAVNVLLPLLLAGALRAGDQELWERVRETYRRYPKRGDNEITRYMAARLTSLPRPPAARSACRQQGLIQLYRNWCEDKRCQDCPVGSARAAGGSSGG